ncbi:MAG TPA: xanthine dehydrogenase family protein subunit M [Stenomitos sp.]
MFYQPTTLQEALELKAKLGASARFLAGGTDLVVGMQKRRLTLDEVIDLSRLNDLCFIHDDGRSMTLGAGCTHAMVESCRVAALADSARQVGGPQIRNRGTIGGQLGTASPAGDVSVGLLALEAEVELVSVRGTRVVPLQDFFVGVGKTVLAPDELISAVRFDHPASSAFYKIGKRNSVAISIVMCAVALGQDGSPRIALGSVAPTPLRLFKTEAFLKAEGLSPASIEEAGRLAREEVNPITDHRAGADYRRDVSGVLVSRLLSDLKTGGPHAHAS